MAERSTRSGSRRTTPQPAPQSTRVGTQSPPKRTIRITRSQSRGISDSEDGGTGVKLRRGAKQATPDGTNGAVGQSSSKSRKGRPANHSRVQQGMKGHSTDSSFDPRNAGLVVSPKDRFAQLTKAGSLRAKDLPDSCSDQNTDLS